MNPIVDISEAEQYFSERLKTSAWDSASLDNREKALIQATRAINRLNFRGEKVETDQEFVFPRIVINEDDEEVTVNLPQAVQDACCELALSYLSGVDTEHEYNNIRVVSHSQDFSKTMYDRFAQPEHIIAGIPSIEAWYLLLPYLRDTRIVKVDRR